MKLKLASASLATRLHRPMRFGSRWRGHELALRVCQLVVLAFVAVLGARAIAHGVALLSQLLTSGSA